MKYLFLLILSGFALANSSPAGVTVVGALARSAAINPGDAFQGVIFLKNTGKKPEEVRVSQSDYSFQADGSNEYGEPGHTPRSNANWISVTPSRVKLAPGETVPVRYKGRAPADARLRGTFWSMIMVEPNAAPAITPEGKPDQVAMGVQTTVRIAIQIVTEVGPGGTRSLQVAGKRLAGADGKRALELDLLNDGERLLIPEATVELFDQGGASIGRFKAARARIYPACSVRAKFDLTKVPAGKYAAMVLLDSGDAQVMGAQYDLEIRDPELPKPLAAPLARK